MEADYGAADGRLSNVASSIHRAYSRSSSRIRTLYERKRSQTGNPLDSMGTYVQVLIAEATSDEGSEFSFQGAPKDLLQLCGHLSVVLFVR